MWGVRGAQVGAAFPQTRVPDLVFLVQFYNFTMFRLTFMLILAALGSFLTPTIYILVYRNFSYRRDPSVLCFGSFKTECFHLDFSSKCLRSDLKSVDRGPPAQSPHVILSVALTEASAPGIPPKTGSLSAVWGLSCLDTWWVDLVGRGPRVLFPRGRWSETMSGLLPCPRTHFSAGSVSSLERNGRCSGAQARPRPCVHTAAAAAPGWPPQDPWEGSQNPSPLAPGGPGAREASSPVTSGPMDRRYGFRAFGLRPSRWPGRGSHRL